MGDQIKEDGVLDSTGGGSKMEPLNQGLYYQAASYQRSRPAQLQLESDGTTSSPSSGPYYIASYSPVASTTAAQIPGAAAAAAAMMQPYASYSPQYSPIHHGAENQVAWQYPPGVSPNGYYPTASYAYVYDPSVYAQYAAYSPTNVTGISAPVTAISAGDDVSSQDTKNLQENNSYAVYMIGQRSSIGDNYGSMEPSATSAAVSHHPHHPPHLMHIPSVASAVSASTSSGKIRRKKDPNAPKNPMSAYLFYITEQRSRITGTEASRDFKEMAQELGAKWRSMSDEEKEPYVDMAKKDRKRYLAEKAAYGNRKVFISSPEDA